MSQSLADQFASTALSGGNAGFIEDLYEQYLKDPRSVAPAWAAYFERVRAGAVGEVAHSPIRERLLARLSLPPQSGGQRGESGGRTANQADDEKVAGAIFHAGLPNGIGMASAKPER